MKFVGIDPGKKGALALIDERAQILELVPTPMITTGTRDKYDVVAIARLFRRWSVRDQPGRGLYVAVERLHPLPMKFRRKGGGEQQGGVIANFNRGVAHAWVWMLTAFGIPFVHVRPQVWQRALMDGYCMNAPPKDRSVAMARHAWPHANLRRTPRARTDDDGIAEALLLADYARRVSMGGAVFAAAARG